MTTPGTHWHKCQWTTGPGPRPTPRRNNFAREFCETKRYEIFRSRNFRGPFFVSCVLVDDFARFVCSSAHLTPHTSTTACPLSLPAIAGLRGAVVVENQCRPGRATQWCVLQPAGFLPCTPCKPSRASQHYDPKKHANRMCAWEGGRAGARAQGGVGATGLAKRKKRAAVGSGRLIAGGLPTPHLAPSHAASIIDPWNKFITCFISWYNTPSCWASSTCSWVPQGR